MYVCKNNKTIILLASSGVPSLNRGTNLCWICKPGYCSDRFCQTKP